MHGYRGDCGIDGRFEQFFDPSFADRLANSTDPRGIARESRFVVGLVAEVLPDDVLGPTLDQFFVGEIEGVLEIEQGGHQADRETRTPGDARTTAHNFERVAEEVVVVDDFPFDIPAGKGRR